MLRVVMTPMSSRCLERLSGSASLRALLVSSWLVACGGDDDDASSEPLPDAGPGDAAAEADAPADPGAPDAPDHDDPRYTVEGLRAWYLVGNALTAGDDTLSLSVTAPEGTGLIGLWLDGVARGTFAPQGATFAVTADLGSVGPGAHEALLAADGAPTAFARLRFTRSHPYYCFVSTDWDDPDNPDANLDRQESLHTLHPALRLTHFAAPYTFTDPDVSPERAETLAAWLRGMRDTYEDEIGLHIHPYCSFVDTTDVPCRTEPSVRGGTDATGYSVVFGSYTEAETEQLLQAADAIFEAQDLGKPTSFRAGAWTAEIHTLRALAATGYRVDASAVAWARLEEWTGLPLYDWNREHWSSIDETSQPYYPSDDDILSTRPPQVAVLEVPDNGALVDYVSDREMNAIFELNWPGGALPEPRVFSIGYHPPNFSQDLFTRMDSALYTVDQHLAADDAGPVVYATASELARVWTLPAE